MNDLLKRLKNSGSVKESDVLSKSIYFNEKDSVPTQLPILNIAFSGRIDGGLVPGLTILAGASKTFKTMSAMYCMKAYFDKYDDAVALFFDSEFGSNPSNFQNMGIDVNRVLHIPIEHIEQLKFDIVKRLEEVKRNDHVFIMIDSIGATPSRKEIDDAIDEKSVADMTRAKAIRSLFRIITPHLTMKDIPCVVISHTYSSMEMYSKQIVGGGTSVVYSANQVFIIGKSQEKDGTELSGFNFTLNVEKSRFVKEKSKFPFTVTFEKGISKYSGLLDIALELGFCVKPSMGWIAKVNPQTGEIEEKKYRAKDTNTKDFWQPILDSQEFKDAVYNRYSISSHSIISDDDINNSFESAATEEEYAD